MFQAAIGEDGKGQDSGSAIKTARCRLPHARIHGLMPPGRNSDGRSASQERQYSGSGENSPKPDARFAFQSFRPRRRASI